MRSLRENQTDLSMPIVFAAFMTYSTYRNLKVKSTGRDIVNSSFSLLLAKDRECNIPIRFDQISIHISAAFYSQFSIPHEQVNIRALGYVYCGTHLTRFGVL